MDAPRRIAFAAMLAFATGCSGDSVSSPGEIGPIRLAVVSGDGQTGAPGEELPQALVASVTDSRGRGLSGQLVNFRVVSGGGTMFAGSSITDRTGIARDYWTLGLTGTQTVEVRAVDPTTGEKSVYATFQANFPVPVDVDADGFTVAQGDCNDNDASIKPGATDNPDPGFIDRDCDGIDGTKTLAVFVSKSGADGAGCGEFASPCLTIAFAQGRATALSRSRIFVATGTYSEAVTLLNGVSIHGGYSTDFAVRSLANRALINGSSEYGTTGLMYTVVGENLSTPAALDAVHVHGTNATGQRADGGSGKHSSAILLRNIPAGNLTISLTKVTAGNGAAGLGGAAGQSASQTRATAGQNGGNSAEFNTTCDATSRGGGGDAGGTGSAAGGAGGAGGTMDSDCNIFSPNYNATGGIAGSNAVTNPSGFGTGGSGGAVCVAGVAGVAGRQLNGANGSGGGSPTATSGILATSSGTSGALGADGTGGGGGGGSGGCDEGTDSYGAGGGGGGSGGVRAPTFGAAGRGGGGSVGIYLDAAHPIITSVEIIRGNGGDGGAGGAGGAGQPGGFGGSGGAGIGTGAGGAGGAGGTGGFAGGGGGGSGGISVGILKVGGSNPSESGITTPSFGAGGAGGSGGARGDSTSGGNGTNGVYS